VRAAKPPAHPPSTPIEKTLFSLQQRLFQQPALQFRDIFAQPKTYHGLNRLPEEAGWTASPLFCLLIRQVKRAP